MAFVPKNAPDLTSNRGVIPPVAPLAPHSSTSPGGFERFQRFSTDQAAPEDSSKQQQNIGGQVGKFSVPCLVDAPTPPDFLLVEQTSGISGGKRLAPGFELVDLPAGAGLMPIYPAGL